MNKEEILSASRRENKARDLAESEISRQADSHASRVGALLCCLISLLTALITDIMLYSPWVIYFGILGCRWLVRSASLKRRSELLLAVLFLSIAVLAFVGFIIRLSEAAA